MSESLADGRICVHYAYTEPLGPEALARDAAILSAAERERAARFAFQRDRRDFIATHALLRRVLSASCGGAPERWQFEAGQYGKPALVPAQAAAARVSFNAAHTRGLAVCAVAAGAVDLGVDVESVRQLEVLDLAERFFAPAEAAALTSTAAADRPLRFVEIWTIKEAFVKALGTGLHAPLDRFVVSLDGDARITVAPPPGEDAGRWAFALFAPAPRDRMAVAVRGGGPWTMAAIRHADHQSIDTSFPSRISVSHT